jgi:hypothetical protein
MPAKPAAADPIEATEAIDEVVAQTITISEFCSRLSESLRKPELIGAFHSTEVAAGTVRATAQAFQAHFDEFVNKPV